MWQEQFSLIKNLSDQANGILIVLSENPKNEHIAAGLALAQTFHQAGKNAILVSPTDVKKRSELQSLPQFDSIKDQVANKDLDVVFDYDESAVDKVSYHIDEVNHKFHLVIQPKRGFQPLDTSSVQFQYSGAAADLVFTIGADSLESLTNFFPELADLTETANVVAIHSYESNFGTIKLDSTGLVGVSELIAYLCQHLQPTLDGQVATLLLAGIEEGSRGFSSNAMTAETFQLIATLLKAGGNRIKISKYSSQGGSTGGFAAALGQRSPKPNQGNPFLPAAPEPALEHNQVNQPAGALSQNTSHQLMQSQTPQQSSQQNQQSKRPTLGQQNKPFPQQQQQGRRPDDKKKDNKMDIHQLGRGESGRSR